MSKKMIFCLGDGKWERKGEGYQKNLRIFNKNVSEGEYQKTKTLFIENDIKIQLTEVVNKELKVYSYEDAWKNFWDKATKKQKSCILDIEQFDFEIFKSITGIEVNKENSKKQELLTKADELIEKANELKKQAKDY